MVKSLSIVIKEKGHGNEVDQRMYVFLASFPKDNEYISFYLSLFPPLCSRMHKMRVNSYDCRDEKA